MSSQYYCKNSRRRQLVRDSANLNGIDYLEVSPDQHTLQVYFLHPLPGESGGRPSAPLLTPGHFRIEGGVRIQNIRVETLNATDNLLSVAVNAAGDFSTYTLRLVSGPDNPHPPAGFDPRLAAVEFSFKVDCPNEFDCKHAPQCPPESLAEPEIDYLAKDYDSFRRLMLDRLSMIMPRWQERNPADLQIALVELLAYAGDHLSYYQDAVATEAYLGTSRQRVSLRRHARLLDYPVHEGCNARTWVHLEVAPGGMPPPASLPAGTRLLTRGSAGEVTVDPDPGVLEAALRENPLVFETLHGLTLHSAHNRIAFYTWSDVSCCLPRGSTRATLRNDPPLSLEAGDVLIFEEILSPTSGTAADADPAHRHPVRLTAVNAGIDPLDNSAIMEIEWHEADALPFPLCLSAEIPGANGAPEVREISVARGNVVLADHGLTVGGEALSRVPDSETPYRPRLEAGDITFRAPYDHEAARREGAVLALKQSPNAALPQVWLWDGDETWLPQRDLLNSGRFAAEFVLETATDGSAALRFGDGVHGKPPTPGAVFNATYRSGSGLAGNIGAEALVRVVTAFSGISRVRNPLPASGGSAPETMEEVRQFAPRAFRTQERAVTESDYARMCERHPEVQKAAARFRWTGSWYTVFITVDRKGGRPVTKDRDFQSALVRHMERYRMAGYDLEIREPLMVPLDLRMAICLKAGYFRSAVKERLLDVFSRYELPDGRRGFFHPDNFTFGQPLYLSRLYAAAMEVDGVESVEIIRLQRWGKRPDGEIARGALQPASLEIIRLDNDPNFPENGKIEFEMRGGL